MRRLVVHIYILKDVKNIYLFEKKKKTCQIAEGKERKREHRLKWSSIGQMTIP